MLSNYGIILLGCIRLSLSLDYADFVSNYRAIARGTDAPEGSYMHVGRIQYNMSLKNPPTFGRPRLIINEGSGFFIKHKGSNGQERAFFFTAAHTFDLNDTDVPTDHYITPGRSSKISLLSKGTITIFYGSVKRENQKEFDVYPNGLYTTPVLGQAHIVRVPSDFCFDSCNKPDSDMIAIELTENQAHQFGLDGAIFVTSKDDSSEKLFQAGEVCKIGSWGTTNENEDGPGVDATRLQQADIMVRDMDYCTDSFSDDHPIKPILNSTQFACFSTHFRSDNDPEIRGGDSGAPVTCGNGNGFLASMVTHSERFATFGPTRASILAFVKDCFYD